MYQCEICGKAIKSTKPAILFKDSDNFGVAICADCQEDVSLLKDTNASPDRRRNAFSHVSKKLTHIPKIDVKENVRNILKNYTITKPLIPKGTAFQKAVSSANNTSYIANQNQANKIVIDSFDPNASTSSSDEYDLKELEGQYPVAGSPQVQTLPNSDNGPFYADDISFTPVEDEFVKRKFNNIKDEWDIVEQEYENTSKATNDQSNTDYNTTSQLTDYNNDTEYEYPLQTVADKSDMEYEYLSQSTDDTIDTEYEPQSIDNNRNMDYEYENTLHADEENNMNRNYNNQENNFSGLNNNEQLYSDTPDTPNESNPISPLSPLSSLAPLGSQTYNQSKTDDNYSNNNQNFKQNIPQENKRNKPQESKPQKSKNTKNSDKVLSTMDIPKKSSLASFYVFLQTIAAICVLLAGGIAGFAIWQGADILIALFKGEIILSNLSTGVQSIIPAAIIWIFTLSTAIGMICKSIIYKRILEKSEGRKIDE